MSNKFSKSMKFFDEIRELFWFWFLYFVNKEKMFTIEIEDGREAP